MVRLINKDLNGKNGRYRDLEKVHSKPPVCSSVVAEKGVCNKRAGDSMFEVISECMSTVANEIFKEIEQSKGD